MDDVLLPNATEIDLEPVLARFRAEGYARLGPILSARGAARMRERADEMMQGEAGVPGLFFQHDSPTGRYEDLAFGEGFVGPSRAYRKLEKLDNDPLFLAWIENPLFERIARMLLGGSVALYRAVLWNKAAHGGMELPWHQDDGVFWGLDRPPTLQIWTALDDASVEAGCVEVVPRTHLTGLASPQGGTVRASELARERAEARALPLPVRAGEALLIHNHVWHRSHRNATGTARRAVGISYLSAETRCNRKKAKPRAFRPVFARASPLG